MSRVQLALNVSDLDAAVGFYSTLFGAEPAKVRPGYANFAIADPPLKLVLIQTSVRRSGGIGVALNHLGVEVAGTEEVAEASVRLSRSGLGVQEEHGTTCCYALQEKLWVEDPDETPWEIYTVVADVPQGADSCGEASSICCDLQPGIGRSHPGSS